MDVDGKVVVITGGASGIGLASARAFAAAKSKLVLGDVEAGPLEAAVASLTAEGADVVGVVTDVTREADVLALRDAALSNFGAAHVIFNNAGVAAGPTIGTPTKVWEWVLDVNLNGVIYGLNAFLPLFLEQNEGHVVNTGSLAGLGGVPGMGAYCASKFAVVGISESLFHELALSGANVGVSALCPGFVKTRIFESQRNMPNELVSYNEDPRARAIADIAQSAVEAGIDASEVAQRVLDAVVQRKFWILTHEHAALRTTEQRLEWMRGGPAPGINLQAATKP
ncbi:MAG: SDR family NAD(P)-dependent oxidoreductase [Acidobacteriota bacterium]|nr:SDR family NAD(P)-dependent oxidoreductase [Acidobacteriota bacterium]MDE3221877.1 SDR family NAD(P)-dependent oxidoreductase [Acidobacteriota bacterium]